MFIYGTNSLSAACQHLLEEGITSKCTSPLKTTTTTTATTAYATISITPLNNISTNTNKTHLTQPINVAKSTTHNKYRF